MAGVRGAVAVAVLGALLAAPLPALAAADPLPGVDAALDRIATRIERDPDGTVPVIVRFAPQADADDVAAALAGTGSEVTRQYRTVDAVAADLDRAGVEELRAAPGVIGVEADRAARVAASTNLTQIGAAAAQDAGGTGRGATVAILDTGVDATHPMLAGRVVGEACFSRNGNCPNGQTTMFGSGSAAPCTYSVNACGHGTHVAGIAAGNDGVRLGVAPEATILAVQVFSRLGNSAISWTSDQMAGLDWVYAQRATFTIAAANLSLGFSLYGDRATCDADGVGIGYRAVTDRLRSAGIATVAATGNDGSTTGISFPACMTGVYGVGSVGDTDTVSSFSNRNDLMSYWAPGEGILSSVPGGYAYESGSSMATPHVVGAFATLRAAYPTATLDETAARLATTGTVPAGDARGKPRIDVWAAIGNDAFARGLPLNPGTISPARASTVGATRESGEPVHAGVTSSGSLWWTFDAPSAGALSLATTGSSIDTVLAVYTGTSVRGLTAVAADDNGGGGTSSAVSITAVEGTRYRIAVAGKGTATGTVALGITWLPYGGYHPVTPARVLDTRSTGGALEQGEIRSLGLLGRAGVPTTGVDAVAMNVTVTDGTAPSVLTVWPAGVARPLASNLNWPAGDTRANLVISGLGVLGAVSMVNATGATHVIVDVVGWYDDGGAVRATGSEFHPVTPARILDTRDGTGSVVAPLGADTTRVVTVAGRGGVPATGATAAVLNVTVTDTTAPSFLTVWPSDVARPTASSLNWPAGATRPNLVVAPLAPDGTVSIYNLAGRTAVVADVVGWYGAGVGDAFVAQAPVRILDTRDAAAPVRQGEARVVRATGGAGVPTWATAVALNVTATGATAPTFLTVWPSGIARPLASSVNLATGETVPNLVIVPVGTLGGVSIYNNTGSTHVVVDVVGWFG
ncbi:MAG: S8 family serine peptidase [Actinomycetes bacterium]